ncbi:MAG: ribonuclease HII [Halanaerobiaceae bacterium]
MNLKDYTIKQLRNYLKNNSVDKNLINKMQNDSRKGVRQLALRYKKKQKQKEKIKKKWQSMNRKLEELHKKGYSLVAGVDEAGRGPLAGPVVASAVILDPEIPIFGINDSKKLSYKKREELLEIIEDKAIAVGIGKIDNSQIDKINIHNATFLAMKKAINNLNIIPDYILVDGNKKIPELNIKQEIIIDGDNKINNIAAGSIVAKVTRDKIIEEYHSEFPEYGFKDNKGYGTKKHIDALKKYGPTPLHRFSYSIVKKHSSK